MTMTLERFRTLSEEDKQTVLANGWQRIREQHQAMLNDLMAETLVPDIPVRLSVSLPPIPDRDEQVRQLFRSDDSIESVVTRDGVKYVR